MGSAAFAAAVPYPVWQPKFSARNKEVLNNNNNKKQNKNGFFKTTLKIKIKWSLKKRDVLISEVFMHT